MSSASPKTPAIPVATPGAASTPGLNAASQPAKSGTPWAKALTGKKRAPEAAVEDAEAAEQTGRLRSEADSALLDTDAAVLVAQLDPVQPTPKTAAKAATSPSVSTSTASAAAASQAAEIGPMTRASSVMPGPEYLSNWMGPAPLGAVAGGAVLLGLAVGGGGKGGGTAADTSAPVLLSAATNSDGSKLILTYNEALGAAALEKNAFTVTADGTAVTVSAAARGTANTHTVELTLATAITSLKAVQVGYTAPAALVISGADASSATKDAAGNRAANFSAQAVTVTDAVAPTLSSGIAYTSADTTTVVLTYSEPLLTSQKPAASNYVVTVNNVSEPVTAVEVAGSRVYLKLQNKIASGTGLANNITVAYTSPSSDASPSNAAVQDITGNDAPSISTPYLISGITFDATAPTLQSASIDATGKTVSLTLSEAVDAAKLAPASAFFVQLTEGGATRSVPVTSASASGGVVTLMLAERLTSTTAGLQLSYASPASGDGASLQDLAGNKVANLIGATVVNNMDTAAPTLAAASFKDGKTLVLTFSEALSATTAAANAFNVTTAGAANSVTAVKVSGSTLELSLANAVASGQSTQVSYTAPTADNATTTNAALQDSAGNDAASINAYSVDTTAPALATTAGAVTGSLGNQILLNFDSPMLASSYPAGSAFQVLGSQSGRINVSTVATSGRQVTLTLASALLPTETVSLSYTAPAVDIATGNLALQDLAGNDLPSLGSTTPMTVSNKIAPLLVKQSLIYDSAAGLNQVVLEFNENLTSTPPAGAFSVKVDTAATTVSNLSVSGKVVTLNLASGLIGTGAATVGYTKPDTGALSDSDGNAVASFSGSSLGFVRSGTSAANTQTGTSGQDYFLGSLGNDALTGGGGADYFAWPAQASPGGWNQTIADFGLKGGSGALQGSLEADVLDLRALLTGYSAVNKSQFLQVGKNGDGKLVLNIDHDGGVSFVPDATLVFNNISVNTANELVINGAQVNATASGLSGLLTLNNVLTQLEADNQLRVL